MPSDQPGPAFLELDPVLVDASTAVRDVTRLQVDGTDHLALLAELVVP